MDGPWPLVEPIGDRIELHLVVEGQVRALRQVLSEEPNGVLTGASLPGAMGVTEVDRSAKGEVSNFTVASGLTLLSCH